VRKTIQPLGSLRRLGAHSPDRVLPVYGALFSAYEI